MEKCGELLHFVRERIVLSETLSLYIPYILYFCCLYELIFSLYCFMLSHCIELLGHFKFVELDLIFCVLVSCPWVSLSASLCTSLAFCTTFSFQIDYHLHKRLSLLSIILFNPMCISNLCAVLISVVLTILQ